MKAVSKKAFTIKGKKGGEFHFDKGLHELNIWVEYPGITIYQPIITNVAFYKINEESEQEHAEHADQLLKIVKIVFNVENFDDYFITEKKSLNNKLKKLKNIRSNS